MSNIIKFNYKVNLKDFYTKLIKHIERIFLSSGSCPRDRLGVLGGEGSNVKRED